MQITVLTCLLLTIQTTLCQSDEDVLRCPTCPALNGEPINPARFGDRPKLPAGTDVLCINLSPNHKRHGDVDGFVLHNGEFTKIKELLDIIGNKRDQRGNRENSIFDLLQNNDDFSKLVMARGGWGKLRPPWG